MLLRIGVIMTALGLLLGYTSTVAAQAEIDLERLQRATVFIMQTRNVGGQPVVTCVGSGTIVSRSGLIVANAHNTVSNRNCNGDRLVISLTIRPGEPPTPTYFAEVAQADEGIDLAILRITEELNGRVIDADSLFLPFVELGDSRNVQLDDTTTIIGYPGVGNDAVEAVRGTISGFVAEPSGGERAWFKTDAAVPGTMTGGGVYDSRGRLIGVPTTVPITPLVPDATCILLDDTNSDGLINRSDSCVPIGGFINALRPSAFIQPLLRGASLGLEVEKLTSSNLNFDRGEAPAFDRLLFAPSVVNNMPTTVIGSLPTGTTNLYLFFDYRNMTPDTIYELRVSINDRPSPTFSLAPVRWSGGRSGLWYIGTTGQTLPNGLYQFTLFINGIASGSQEIVVGAPATDTRSFSNITFGIEDPDNPNTFYARNNVLASGAVANARFIYRNIPDGTTWTALWYYNGTLLQEVTSTWVNDDLDVETIRISADGGVPLPPGTYRLELYIEGSLSALGDFVIAGEQDGVFPQVFDSVRFNNAEDAEDAIDAVPSSNFQGDLSTLFAVFDWARLSPGTLWRMRWSIDDVVFYDEIVPWDNMEDGRGYITRLTSETGIPDGSYRMELLINDTLLGVAEAEVGIGQLPIDSFAEASGVQLNGFIFDAETLEGIPGVTFVLVSEDFSVADFTWNAEQIYALAVTDRNGRFQLDRPLAYDAPYSVVIRAAGYLPIEADAVIVTEEDDNPLEVRIALTKD